MLYLLIQEHIEDRGWDGCTFVETVIGVYETEELAKKEIESLITEGKEDFCKRFGEEPSETFTEIENGYKVFDLMTEETITYSVKPVTELNKRID